MVRFRHGLLAAAATVLVAGASGAREGKLGEGEGVFRPVAHGRLLEVPLQAGLSPAERAGLGLPAEGPFRLGDLAHDLVVVEFFNSSCYACALMAPVMDEVWHRIAAREDLAGRVRFVGIGAGNTTGQVRTFRELYDTPFPMIADPEFAAFDALGTLEGTPFLLLLRRAAGSPEARTARGHVGYIPDAGRVVEAIEASLGGEPLPPGTSPLASVGASWRNLKPDLPPGQLEARVVAAAAAAGLAGAVAVPVALEPEGVFYRLEAGGRRLWAQVAGRAKVCNVCHDIFFILLFDDAGRIAWLEPITITKYKNVEFDEHDTAFLRSRVTGRRLGEPIAFDPAVDAVSTATMSSALVFDTLRRLRETYAAMVREGVVVP